MNLQKEGSAFQKEGSVSITRVRNTTIEDDERRTARFRAIVAVLEFLARKLDTSRRWIGDWLSLEGHDIAQEQDEPD